MGDHIALCRVLGQYLMYVDTRDISLAPHMLLNGYWESWITQRVAAYVQPNMTCVDAGANAGYYSCIMADIVGPGGRLVTCEPNAQALRLLERTMDVNGFAGRTRIVRAALSDAAGTVTLSVPEHHPINGAISGRPMVLYESERVEEVEVAAVTLDEVLADEPRVDFIKVDVEGAEPKLWRGLRETWRRCSPTLLMEYVPGLYEPTTALVDELLADGAELGYVGYDGSIAQFEVSMVTDPAEVWMLWVTRRR